QAARAPPPAGRAAGAGLGPAEPHFAAAAPVQSGDGALGIGGPPADAPQVVVDSKVATNKDQMPGLQPAVPLAVDRTDALKESDASAFRFTQPAGGAKADLSALAADNVSAKPATAAGASSDSPTDKADDLYWGISHGGGDVVVIQVDISSDAAQRGAFDKLLAKNQIAMEDQSGAQGLRRQQAAEPSA